MTSSKTFSIIIALLILVGSVSASQFAVNNVELSSTEWGSQKATISLLNSDLDYKYVAAVTEVRIFSLQAEPIRKNRLNFIIEPGDSIAPKETKLVIGYEVPPSYGEGNILIRLYDVVDTLDMLLTSQEFYNNEFSFTVDTAEALKDIIRNGIQVPLFVDQSMMFDGFFNRAIALMLHGGKDLKEITELCGMSLKYVHQRALELRKNKFFNYINLKYIPSFSIMDKERLGVILPEINKIADKLYDNLKNNLGEYDSALIDLADRGLITKDPHNLLDGGSVLYHKHASIFGLFLWDNLGREFVNDGQAFNIFENSDQILANMGDFMYLIEGDKSLAGKTFYYNLNDVQGEQLYCGIVERPLKRPPIDRDKNVKPVGWDFGPENQPIYYSYNLEKLKVPFGILSNGLVEHMDYLKGKIDELCPVDVNGRKQRGARYWCWNIVIGKLMDKFAAEGIIEIEGAGMYIFQKVEY